MAGRNKQPLTVIQGKGKSKHITKDEAAKRAAHEEKMRGNNDKVIAPKYLLKKQKLEFEKIAEELIALDIISNLDVDTLARYIEAKTEYQRLGPVIRKLNPLKDLEAYTKLSRTRKQLSDECRSYASDLGLTITSRLKLVIPSTIPAEAKTEAEKRFGNRL
ncbi:phage terminase small subunit P27 family [Rummeliibacillus stabekisii]|uniref:Terminase n=1 Tax=Rummeliibacillus stabekisii TaxID=241244 RepID=A0A143H9P9_9BACL|nr:phage terminase small subunit P27 family [Rummeliibacillus stabekisii]AMW98442.1 terminase [Rummeliibacillus stabekisii]